MCFWFNLLIFFFPSLTLTHDLGVLGSMSLLPVHSLSEVVLHRKGVSQEAGRGRWSISCLLRSSAHCARPPKSVWGGKELPSLLTSYFLSDKGPDCYFPPEHWEVRVWELILPNLSGETRSESLVFEQVRHFKRATETLRNGKTSSSSPSAVGS